MHYSITYKDSHKHFIDVEIIVDNLTDTEFVLQLPAWRPGRYEMQNFARNISQFSVGGMGNTQIDFEKIGKEQWLIKNGNNKEAVVKYSCYAYQLDAGGAWVDGEQLYLNFAYCAMYMEERSHEKCEVILGIPDDYRIATGLTVKGKRLYADNYLHLIDCPVIASAGLQHQDYIVNGILFHIWIQGDVNINWPLVIRDFKKFSEEQILTMGDFPEKDYHFLFQLLPYRQHHGVEHRNSTIITLGPAELIHSESLYTDFLSISSHELFHSWNIVKIRPAEMMPYDLSKENFFKSGYVAEGVTTFYGEYFLARSGVFPPEKYFLELNGLFKKHFENYGNENLSVAESSFDLWVDGYVAGIPNRKVSIYVKGAVIAFLLDIIIRRNTGNKKCLDDVMKILYNDFAKEEKGYTMQDFESICEQTAGIPLQQFFIEAVYGCTNLQDQINDALAYLGCEFEVCETRYAGERVFGLKIQLREGRTFVEQTEPGSPADKIFSKDDEVIAIDGLKVANNIHELMAAKPECHVTIFRKNKLQSFVIKSDRRTYFKQYKVRKNYKATAAEKKNFKAWLKWEW
ncbi:MAG TPA: M61 family peptidase [Cytophagaceae bacterium]|jgi:predicted metalloprotease with PDZ domain